MDREIKKEILDEFFVQWKFGKSPKMIASELSGRASSNDINECRDVFEKWVKSKKPWSHVDKML